MRFPMNIWRLIILVCDYDWAPIDHRNILLMKRSLLPEDVAEELRPCDSRQSKLYKVTKLY
jgi:hypothetical protein